MPKNENEFHRSNMISWLQTIQRDLDPILLEARKKMRSNNKWMFKLMVRSILGLLHETNPGKSNTHVIFNILSNRFTTWITFIVALLSYFGFEVTDWLDHVTWTYFLYVPYITSVGSAFWVNCRRMLTLDDPYFSPSAYEKFRPKEYHMFYNYLVENKYSFESLHEWISQLYHEVNLESIIELHEKELKQTKEHIATLSESLKTSEQSKIDILHDIEFLQEHNETLFRRINAIESGFEAAIDVLYRLRGDSHFNVNDLRVLTSFSLFELIDDKLYMIAEQGTTETPQVIDIKHPKYQHYSSVQLCHNNETIAFTSSDREGRTVASYWLSIPHSEHDKILIYNFHYPMSQVQNRDIIESKEMYRFVRVLCLLLDERGLLVRKGELRDHRNR